MSGTTIKCSECGSIKIAKEYGDMFKCEECGAIFVVSAPGSRKADWEKTTVTVGPANAEGVIGIREFFGWEYDGESFAKQVELKRNKARPSYEKLAMLEKEYLARDRIVIDLKEQRKSPEFPRGSLIAIIIIFLIGLGISSCENYIGGPGSAQVAGSLWYVALAVAVPFIIRFVYKLTKMLAHKGGNKNLDEKIKTAVRERNAYLIQAKQITDSEN